jgi:hypothetical protein
MAIYTVHLPLAKSGQDSLQGAALVRDGFSRSAFAFSLLWLLRHKLWFWSVMAFFLAVAVWLVPVLLDWPGWVSPAVSLILVFLLGLEASVLRRDRLMRRGWQEVAIVSAPNEEEAERRFFARHQGRMLL